MKSNNTSEPLSLSRRQLYVLRFILSSGTYEEAAKLAKISAKQIYEWLKEPIFREELKKQRNNMFCNALLVLKSNTQKAVCTLLALLDDKDPRIRLLAFEKILSNAFKGTELFDFEERIGVLENLTRKSQN